MEESNIFKRFIYNGIGFASLATKKMEELVNDLLSQGKVSEEEGKKIMDNFKSATNRTKDDLEKDMRTLMEQMMEKMDIAQRRDIKNLEARITTLENIHLKEKGATPGPMDRSDKSNMPPGKVPHGDPQDSRGNRSEGPGPIDSPGPIDKPGPFEPKTGNRPDSFKDRNDLNNPDNPTTI